MKTSYANAALLVASLIAVTAAARAADKPAVSATAKSEVPAAAAAPAADADLALVQQHCSTCHLVDQVTARNKTADEWAETIDRMVDHGMQISPEDSKRITDYLAAHYGAK